jgi:ABC-type sugar transport system ATPase subunit
VAHQQLVEITKAMAMEPSILLLDEPTSALSRKEAEKVFAFLRRLADQGVLIVYITHRLQEIHRMADTVTALRDGTTTGSIPAAGATPERIVSMMFGEQVRFTRVVDTLPTDIPVLDVQNLSRGEHFQDISFTLHRGEILGIAGLMGSGRTELLRAIAGADRADAGSVTVDGHTLLPESPQQMKDLGVVLTPENRKEQGLVLPLATRLNVCLASYGRIARRGFITTAREHAVTRRIAEDLAITMADPSAPVASLSGGNQQKVVLGKWLATAPRVILFDEPTRGIDIRSKVQMFQTILRLSREGIGSVVVSSELEELPDICHRILTMKEGRLTGSLDPATTTLEELFSRCMA